MKASQFGAMIKLRNSNKYWENDIMHLRILLGEVKFTCKSKFKYCPFENLNKLMCKCSLFYWKGCP